MGNTSISGPTKFVKQLFGLIAYVKYIFESYNSGPNLSDDPFHLFSPDEWVQHTCTEMRSYLIQHLPNSLEPKPVSPPGPTSYSSEAVELMGFKRALKEKLMHTPH